MQHCKQAEESMRLLHWLPNTTPAPLPSRVIVQSAASALLSASRLTTFAASATRIFAWAPASRVTTHQIYIDHTFNQLNSNCFVARSAKKEFVSAPEPFGNKGLSLCCRRATIVAQVFYPRLATEINEE